MLRETENDEEALNRHFEDGFSNKGRTEEDAKGDQEVTAEEPC